MNTCARNRVDLVRLTKTDADPRVRHRAHLLLAVADAPSWDAAARQAGTDAQCLRKWARRFVADGRNGLVDRPRSGRPRRLGIEAEAMIVDALDHTPLDYGYPTTTWTIVDVRDHLAQAGWSFALTTVERAMRRLGYVYRRPKHDLHHRQDAEAVASAAHALEQLQKRGVVTPGIDSSILMNVPFILTPVWQRSGSAGASHGVSRQRDRIDE